MIEKKLASKLLYKEFILCGYDSNMHAVKFTAMSRRIETRVYSEWVQSHP